MIEIFNWDNATYDEQAAFIARAEFVSSSELADGVRNIVNRVKEKGDIALREFSARFDGYDAVPTPVAQEKLEKATADLSPDMRKSLDEAIENVSAFHKAQLPSTVSVETRPGVVCELQWRAIDRVGLYVPGGLAPLFSAVMMLALPAQIAGCKTRVLCTPPGKDGSINPVILAAANLCGVSQVFPIGGAQAIAAMAYGTKTVPKVDKIFGPGNAYVTQAKQLVAQEADGAAIDMPAGPSEVMVIADKGANPAWVAADMLAQAEHGADSQAICVTNDAALAEAVRHEIEKQFAMLGRSEIIAKSLRYSSVLVVKDMATALEVANRYAPEHLILQIDDATKWVDKVRNASAVFVGPWSPETAGDYASGGNHVLPTYGYARSYGGLSLTSFMKNMSVQTLTKEGLSALAPTLVRMAKAEGLDAHANAVILRGVADGVA